MKFKRSMIFVIIAALVVFMGVSYILFGKPSSSELTYVYEKSSHGSFQIRQDVVVFGENITVRNNTKKDLYFYMYADVRKDKGLVVEDYASAYEKDPLVKEKFFIKANSTDSFIVEFKAKKGDKKQKQDRMPPNSIKFEVLQ